MGDGIRRLAGATGYRARFPLRADRGFELNSSDFAAKGPPLPLPPSRTDGRVDGLRAMCSIQAPKRPAPIPAPTSQSIVVVMIVKSWANRAENQKGAGCIQNPMSSYKMPGPRSTALRTFEDNASKERPCGPDRGLSRP